MGAASAAGALARFEITGVRNHLDCTCDAIAAGIDDSPVAVRKGIARGQKVQTGAFIIEKPGFKGATVHAGGTTEVDTALKCNVVQFQFHLWRNHRQSFYGNVFQNQQTGLQEQVVQGTILNRKGMALEIIQKQIRIHHVLLQFQGSVTMKCPDTQNWASCIVRPQIQRSGEITVQGERGGSILRFLDGNAILRDKGLIRSARFAALYTIAVSAIGGGLCVVTGVDLYITICNGTIFAASDPAIDPITV